jgi:hypothetical protein
MRTTELAFGADAASGETPVFVAEGVDAQPNPNPMQATAHRATAYGRREAVVMFTSTGVATRL